MPAPHRPQVIPAILAKEELQDSSIPSNARILAALLQPWEFWDYQKAQNSQEGNNSGYSGNPRILENPAFNPRSDTQETLRRYQHQDGLQSWSKRERPGRAATLARPVTFPRSLTPESLRHAV